MGWLKKKLKKAGLTKKKFGGALKVVAIATAVAVTGGAALGPLAGMASTLGIGAGGVSGIMAAGTAAAKTALLSAGTKALDKASKSDGSDGRASVPALNQARADPAVETSSAALPGTFIHYRYS